jgi:hypothetical protein
LVSTVRRAQLDKNNSPIKGRVIFLKGIFLILLLPAILIKTLHIPIRLITFFRKKASLTNTPITWKRIL